MYCKRNVFKIQIANMVWEIILSINGAIPLFSMRNKVQGTQQTIKILK